MIEFLNRIFGRQQSSTTAKERLRLVLMSDHLSLAPDMVEAMKRDLVDVISRYVEVDRSKIEVNFEQQDKALAMLANIPILSVNRNSSGGGGSSRDEAPAEPVAVVPEPAPLMKPLTSGSTGAPRRRRRRKSGGSSASGAGAPAPAT